MYLPLYHPQFNAIEYALGGGYQSILGRQIIYNLNKNLEDLNPQAVNQYSALKARREIEKVVKLYKLEYELMSNHKDLILMRYMNI